MTQPTNGFTFDFASVSVGGPDYSRIPVGERVSAEISGVEYRTFGPEKNVRLCIDQTLMLPDGQMEYTTKISEKQVALLKQYILAVHEDPDGLNGQPITAQGLASVLVGQVVEITFRQSNWTTPDGREMQTTQVSRVYPQDVDGAPF